MAFFEDDLSGLAAATQIIRSSSVKGGREALADLASLARVMQDLSDLHIWNQPQLVLDVLRLLDIVQQATFYSLDPQSAVRSPDQMRHRFFNLYGAYPQMDCGHFLNLLASANWVTLPKSGQFALTPVGRRLVGHVLRIVHEALEYHRLDRVQQGLLEIKRAEAYAEAFDRQGIEGADTLGQAVHALRQLAADLETDMAMRVFNRSALQHVALIQEQMRSVMEKIEAALEHGDGRHSPAQLRVLAAEAAQAYAVAHRISYEAVGEIWRSTSGLGQAPVRRINETLFLEFLRQAAQDPKGGLGAILAFVDDGPDAAVPLMLPFRLQPPAGSDMIERGLAAMAGAAPRPPRLPPPPVTFRPARAATMTELAQMRVDDGMADFAAVVDRIETHLATARDLSLAELLGTLAAEPADAPVLLLALGALLRTPKASLRVAPGETPSPPWFSYHRYRVVSGRLEPLGPHALRVRAELPLRRTIPVPAGRSADVV